LLAAASNNFCELAVAVCYGIVERLAEVHHASTDAPADRRKIAQYRTFEGADGAIETWDDPVWGSLVDCQRRSLW
jgi:hypothetical protein